MGTFGLIYSPVVHSDLRMFKLTLGFTVNRLTLNSNLNFVEWQKCHISLKCFFFVCVILPSVS